MKIIKWLSVLSIALFSCHFGNYNSSGKHVLLSNTLPHYFSDNSKKDTFKIVLTGDSLKTAKAVFFITSYKGVRIYADTFKGGDLTQNVDGDPIISDSKKLANIKESVRSFFDESKFSKPPFFKNGDNDTTNWDEIKSDKTAIGYEVVMNHVDFRIAYSKKQHKVLVYWNDEEAGD